MSKSLKIRDQETSHIPHYKRSIGDQPVVRTTKRSKRRKTYHQRMALSTWLVFGIMVVFIAYSLLPWDKISEYVKLVENSSLEPQQADVALYRPLSFNEPSFSSAPSAEDEDGTLTVLFKVTSGNTLKSTLENHGIPKEQAEAAQSVFTAFKKQRNLRAVIKAGRSFEGEFKPDGTLSQINIKLSDNENLVLTQSAPAKFTPSVLKVEKALHERVVMGTITSSFAAAAVKAGLGYDMVDDLVDIFSDRISFHRDFRKGDRFSLIYHEHETRDRSSRSSGPILAAALEVKGKHFTAIRYVGADGKARYFNEDGELIGNTFLRYPVKFSRISSQFSDGRLHPVLKIKRPHNGVDFAAPTGTPVRTVGDGVVTFAGRKGGHGIIVEIKHSDRYTTGYSHLSAISPGIIRGKRVTKGTLIGKVGMTGLATGPHLHFSLYDHGKYVDPLKAKLPKADELRPNIRISHSYLARARYTLEHYQTIANSKILQN